VKVLVGFNDKDYPGVKIFEKIGSCDFIRYDKEFLLKNIHNYDVLIPHLFTYLDSEILKSAVNLKLIATPSTGTNHIDLGFVNKAGLMFNSLNDSQDCINDISSTAELCWLLIISCARNLREAINQVVTHNSWINTDTRGIQLKGKTIGIVGYGRLGKFVAQYANSFGMNVLAYDIDENKYDSSCIPVSLDYLLSNSDVITLHAKLTSENYHLIDKEKLELIKTKSIFVNTARGELVDSSALYQCLCDGKISSIGIDVASKEYESTNLPVDPLVEASLHDNRIIVTPHIGGSTIDAHSIVFEALFNVINKRLLKNGT